MRRLSKYVIAIATASIAVYACWPKSASVYKRNIGGDAAVDSSSASAKAKSELKSSPQVALSESHSQKDQISNIGKPYLGGILAAEVGIGSQKNQLGVNRIGAPLGPSDLVKAADGSIYILDQVNERVMQVTKDGQVEPLFSYQNSVYSSLAISANGDILLLDPYKSKAISRFSKTGMHLEKVPLDFKGEEQGRALLTTGDGNIFVEGQNNYYRLTVSGELQKLPGRPFFNNSHRYVNIIKKATEQFEVSIYNDYGKVTSSFLVEGPYQSVADITSDNRDRIHISFDREVSSNKANREGVFVPLSVQRIIEIFSREGQRINTVVLEQVQRYEHDRDSYIDPQGEIVRFSSDANSIRVVRHNAAGKAVFANPNAEG